MRAGSGVCCHAFGRATQNTARAAGFEVPLDRLVTGLELLSKKLAAKGVLKMTSSFCNTLPPKLHHGRGDTRPHTRDRPPRTVYTTYMDICNTRCDRDRRPKHGQELALLGQGSRKSAAQITHVSAMQVLAHDRQTSAKNLVQRDWAKRPLDSA
jgi:hypothetical protein